ncbi:phosphotriesterase family protein [Dorea sp. D27]|uniref:phosphotriesterase family protein n=1 Tax=Dorea sp. D27 TaxID=658665 RepID=UPI000673A0E1|nr:phosphotriesterase [Dorea sp. D27]KMZ53388.1 putative phosphotriesterase [Dorea sp. D27]
MPYIQTVTGQIPPDTLGFCHCHEHLMIRKGQSYLVNEALCIDSYDKTRAELELFRKSGGAAIVDAQPAGCSRDAEALCRLGHETGIQIIASTGFHKMAFYPQEHWIFDMSEVSLAALFVRELTEGMYTDGDYRLPVHSMRARAGILKCAYDICGLTSQYKKLFDAAICAAVHTGAPLMVHIEQGALPLELVSYLDKKKMPLNRVIFCHMDRAVQNLSVHKEVCRQGIFLEYDTIGRLKYHSDKREAEIFAAMLSAGYENQLLFSLDTTRERLKCYTPEGIGLTYILESFIPLLTDAGITEEQIRKISCANCRRILTINNVI